MEKQTVVVIGAGAIGCFVGGHWALRGMDVHFLARPEQVRKMQKTGLHLTSSDHNLSLSEGQINVTDDPQILRKADIIVLAIKAHGLPQAIVELAEYATDGATILCLLNGISPVQNLRDKLPNQKVIAGMVPYNVVWQDEGHLHRSSVGKIALQNDPVTIPLADSVSDSGAPVVLHQNMQAVQYGKLLLNLNNPINALSGLSVYEQLSQRGYRLIYAAVLNEALGVYNKAGITYEKVGPLPPKWVVRILKAPDFLFNSIALRIQRLDRHSMTSMAVDLAQGKVTEVDTINGEIVALAESVNAKAPLNERLVELIHEAEESGQKCFTAAELTNCISLK